MRLHICYSVFKKLNISCLRQLGSLQFNLIYCYIVICHLVYENTVGIGCCLKQTMCALEGALCQGKKSFDFFVPSSGEFSKSILLTFIGSCHFHRHLHILLFFFDLLCGKPSLAWSYTNEKKILFQSDPWNSIPYFKCVTLEMPLFSPLYFCYPNPCPHHLRTVCIFKINSSHTHWFVETEHFPFIQRQLW